MKGCSLAIKHSLLQMAIVKVKQYEFLCLSHMMYLECLDHKYSLKQLEHLYCTLKEAVFCLTQYWVENAVQHK